MIYNREKREYEEVKESNSGVIEFLYTTFIGNILLKLIIARPIFSKLIGLYYRGRLSKSKIQSLLDFASNNNIEVKMDGLDKYKSYNDFFTRTCSIKVDKDKNSLISPAQSKLYCYRISSNLEVKIKGNRYTLQELLDIDEDNSQIDINSYTGGYCLVFRLSTTDYHRYIHIDTGERLKSWKIKGKLHTVRMSSAKYRVYAQNKRVVSVLNGQSLGEYIQIEVGALTVGKIVNVQDKNYSRGKEKGHFELGGSTIVLLIKPNKIELNTDIIRENNLYNEVKVDIGERIGIII